MISSITFETFCVGMKICGIDVNDIGLDRLMLMRRMIRMLSRGWQKKASADK